MDEKSHTTPALLVTVSEFGIQSGIFMRWKNKKQPFKYQNDTK